MNIIGLDHVQLAAPPNSEEAARRFFGEILGLDEVEKPEVLRKRGGVWFQIGNQQLHIGIEESFVPAKKAHPAFEVRELDELKKRVDEFEVDYVSDGDLEGANRIFVFDPFGNRLEFLEWL
ncbi:VOC family protein [Aliicoccus persicus]|uniref:Predicted dioxygenase of extradiol dioxygenase family n=1 Tax=Aliicoccus persicus TaxID=930138 RepID=A0A662Z4X2_9STAP|nr:VOC family protein [Aliicoccus persicus]SEW14419.1 Predicted dioxygenase of extradiol dioxygenase family [Aliicoccus persicus]